MSGYWSVKLESGGRVSARVKTTITTAAWTKERSYCVKTHSASEAFCSFVLPLGGITPVKESERRTHKKFGRYVFSNRFSVGSEQMALRRACRPPLYTVYQQSIRVIIHPTMLVVQFLSVGLILPERILIA